MTTRSRSLRALAVALVGLLAWAATAASSTAVPADTRADRAFSCSGTAGDRFTSFSVTGRLSEKDRAYAVTVTSLATGAAVSTLAGRATRVGPSTVHTGYVAWDVTGPDAAGDLYQLSSPPVLPGGGGFFDADLEILFGGGVNGSIDVIMTDCTVTGPAVEVSSRRTFTCTGTPAEAWTKRTVTGSLDRQNRPVGVTVTDATGGVLSARTGTAALVGPSWLQTGYTQWDVTGPTAAPDLYYLHIPPVLPNRGGFFDAQLEIEFDGGNLGNWQVVMTDCTVA